jgi:tRNA-binding EMAP/Myf-like protein
MVNLVYQPSTMGDMLAIYIDQTLPSTHYLKKENVVVIYHLEKMIGINVYDPLRWIKNLKPGILRQMNLTDIGILNHQFKQLGIDWTLDPFQSGFVVGEVKQVDVHPDADALFVCQVHVGSKALQIVTNSQKVKVNHRVVVALPGAMLLDGQVLQEGMMLKVLSQGMFCSEKTLGISPETQVGVYLLDDSFSVGKDFYAS